MSADEYQAGLFDYVNPFPHPWRTLRAVILDRLDRTEEAIALAARGARAGARVGRAGAARQGAAGARHARARQRARAPARGRRGARGRRLEAAAREGAVRATAPALRLARKPTEAREPLRRALELADVCGAAPLVERARAELHATGARPRATALGGVDCADRLRAAGRRPRRRRAVEPRDRPGAVRDPEDGRGAPLQHLPQARDPPAGASSPGVLCARTSQALRNSKLWGGG